MADGGLAVLDGTHLREADLRLPIPNGAVTASQLLQLAENEASAHLFGLSLPDTLKSSVLDRLNGGDSDAVNYLDFEFIDEESQKSKKLKQYLLALANQLKDDPIVVSILDGSALRVFLDDEDDFAMLAENLFTDLDTDDNGKLHKSDIKTALVHMGAEMGVPPFSECRDLLDSILKKHGAEGDDQLGQAQFAQLLQSVLQDLGNALVEKPLTVIQNVKVINGSKLNKILSDEALLNSTIERIFKDWNSTSTGTGNKEKLWSILESKGVELGLPPAESDETVLPVYDQVFNDVGEEKLSGDLDRVKFQEFLKVLFEKFAAELESNPVFIGLDES